ncbi:MAG: ORF6N domain-containing protein [Chthoniobacterales bacterium]|nr:ORF6N domain-containing protein [Chthoniobacterales bacterium]
MKKEPTFESLILTIRNQKVLLDADLATIYDVPTKRLNEQVKRNAARFPEDFIFQLTAEEKQEVVANCDHLARLKFSKSLPYAFTEHGAIMAATVLNSPEAVKMSVFVVRAFVQMREQLATNAAILKRLAEIDKTLLEHDQVLGVIWRQIQPLLAPPPDPPKPRIGFHCDEKP